MSQCQLISSSMMQKRIDLDFGDWKCELTPETSRLKLPSMTLRTDAKPKCGTCHVEYGTTGSVGVSTLQV